MTSLPDTRLRQVTMPESLGFSRSDELEPLPFALGQKRAEEAIAFALAMNHPGYNVFVMGRPGEGRHAAAFRLTRAKAAGERTPPDFCYLHNFADPRAPRLLRLPAGRGALLKADLQRFCRDLPPAIEAALEADSYRQRIEALREQHKKREEEALAGLDAACRQDGLCLLNTAEGFVFAPLAGDKAMPTEAFEALAENERQKYEELATVWGNRLSDLLLDFPGWRHDLNRAVARAARHVLRPTMAHLTRALRRAHADLAEVIYFIDAVCDDVIERVVRGGSRPDASEGDEETFGEEEEAGGGEVSLRAALRNYQVNLLVGHGLTQGAPVVSEDNPGFGNLIGSIEHTTSAHGQNTSFDMIRPGALHRANGGYLILDAQRLLAQPFAWDGLKRALKSGRIAIEPPAEAQGWSTQVSLRPEEAPCAVKVILIGERHLYELLMENDPDFRDLFKVSADFSDEIARTAENERHFARLLAGVGQKAGLPPFAAAAIARLIEEAARHAGHARRLSLDIHFMTDLMREAEFHAKTHEGWVIERADIDAALAARARRAGRYPENVLEDMLEGSVLISTDGERIGQVNALVVVEVAGVLHGHPARITATARVGDGDVVDIEREADLGGSLHSKGVLILTAFLAARYARQQPLSLAASLVFEQSYGEVEGDSASLAELCALLSALARAPIRQSLALTGSVNQFGEVQVIGGVNEKIEGFYDLCVARGLTGEQGVLIPAASVAYLMLRPDVVEAVASGRFHVYPVTTVDETMEYLTGIAAGQPDTHGRLPKGSINERVARALAEMSAIQHPGRDSGQRDRPPIRRTLRHLHFSEA
ncbi:MAG: AAA family ATPase [Betaproteobacteria bacterium]|nr:AAA family ATPase [Betaproteobacteria bacterium]